MPAPRPPRGSPWRRGGGHRRVTVLGAAEPKRRVVVLTHYAPTAGGTSDPFLELRPAHSAFCTELSGAPCWGTASGGNVVLWAFGHTQWCCDFVRRGVRVYSNARGQVMPGQSSRVKGFDAGKYVEV